MTKIENNVILKRLKVVVAEILITNWWLAVRLNRL